MKLERIHEHTVCTSLLPDGANILDVGCRGFLFAEYFKTLSHNVHSVDIEDFSFENWGDDGKYLRCAISDFDGMVSIKRNNDMQATRIVEFDPLMESVRAMTLSTYSQGRVVNGFWDLIKIDVEGSEYEIIMSLEKAPAKQLSIEFHLHTGAYELYEMTMMEDKLKALGYYPAQHEMTEEHGAGMNFWDSLFILK